MCVHKLDNNKKYFVIKDFKMQSQAKSEKIKNHIVQHSLYVDPNKFLNIEST